MKTCTILNVRWFACCLALAATGVSQAQPQSEIWTSPIPTTSLNSGDQTTGAGNWTQTNTLQANFPRFNPTGRTLTGMNVSYSGAQSLNILVWRTAPSFAGVNANNQPVYSIMRPGSPPLWANGSGAIFFNHTFTFTPTTPLVQSHTYPTLPVASGAVPVPSAQWPNFIGTVGTVAVQLRARQNGEVFPSNGSAGYRWEGAFTGTLQIEYVYVNNNVTVSGNLTLLDTVPGPGYTRSILVEVVAGTQTFFTNANIAGNGTYSISVPANLVGSAQLRADGSSFLKTLTTVNLTGSDVIKDLTLRNGDVDNTGEVDAADIDAVIAAFGSAGQPVTDVDMSGEVDAADIDIVISNFGETDQ